MAILRSTDGKFYEVADEQLTNALIPAEELKNKLNSAKSSLSQAETKAPEAGGNTEEVTAHGWCWRRNCFNNCYR